MVIGSAHRLTGNNKPHNSLYVIDNLGQIVDRHDKRFCSAGRTANWRDRAMAGELHSGTLTSDPRSADRTSL